MSELNYNCTDIELVLCDYLDNALPGTQKDAVERHAAGCAGCREMVEDARLAIAFTERCAIVEPPPELLTRIMHAQPGAQKSMRARGGIVGWFRNLVRPVMQPRFAMGMAMTILSFSMLGKFAGPVRPLTPEDLNPMSIVANIDDRVHRIWNGAVKYYESLRVVYEIQTRLHEWNEEEQQRRNEEKQQTPAAEDSQGK